jgi:hypothetical protein
MAKAPSRVVVKGASFPWKLPIGVRFAAVMTTGSLCSLIFAMAPSPW